MDGTEAQREFWLPVYSSWTAFVAEIVGVWAILGGLANGTCSFNQPMPFPGYTNLVPNDIKVSPKNPKSIAPNAVASFFGTNDYTGGAKVTVGYRSLYNVTQQRIDLPGIPNGTYLSYSSDIGAEFLTAPGRAFLWMESPDTPTQQTPTTMSADASPGILTPTGQHTLTWDRVLLPPWGAIDSMRGMVNNASFLSSPPGTMLFLGAQVSRQFQFTNDSGFWRVEYKFSQKSRSLNSGTKVGWNYFYRDSPINGENWCLAGAAPGTQPGPNATPGGNKQLNDALEQAEALVQAAAEDYQNALATHGPQSPVTASALNNLLTEQGGLNSARFAAEQAGGGLYAPPYQSADFTQLFQMGGGLVCV